MTYTDNSDAVKKELRESLERAAEAIGLQAVGYAKLLCPVDTGLLRNSLTYAISGKAPAITSYKSNATNKAGKVIDVKTGVYQGRAPADENVSVYIGTNVYYAAYQEMGTSKTAPQPFMEPAITRHKEEYKAIARAFIGE